MRRFVAPLLAVGMLAASAGIVAADEPIAYYVLDVFSCTLSTDLGEFVEGSEVPAGSEVILFEGWIANTKGQLLGFLKNVTWVLDVNDEPVDITQYLSGPIDVGPFWGDFWSFSIGTLDAGETLDTHYDNVLKAATYDGSVRFPRGSISNGGIDCTVTGAS